MSNSLIAIAALLVVTATTDAHPHAQNCTVTFLVAPIKLEMKCRSIDTNTGRLSEPRKCSETVKELVCKEAVTVEHRGCDLVAKIPGLSRDLPSYGGFWVYQDESFGGLLSEGNYKVVHLAKLQHTVQGRCKAAIDFQIFDSNDHLTKGKVPGRLDAVREANIRLLSDVDMQVSEAFQQKWMRSNEVIDIPAYNNERPQVNVTFLVMPLGNHVQGHPERGEVKLCGGYRYYDCKNHKYERKGEEKLKDGAYKVLCDEFKQCDRNAFAIDIV